MQILCPKCQNLMKQFHRNGVQIDQCSGCHGIFLDRGEMEHLLEAEQAYNAPPMPPQGGGYRDDRPRYDDRPRQDDRRYDDRRDDRRYDDRRDDHKYSKKRKRSSIFEELFDF